MKIQDIGRHLNEVRNWYIILTSPLNERKTKEALDNKGMITYLPTICVKRQWNERVRRIQIPAVNRCVFVYASDAEMEILRTAYPVLPIDITETGS